VCSCRVYIICYFHMPAVRPLNFTIFIDEFNLKQLVFSACVATVTLTASLCSYIWCFRIMMLFTFHIGSRSCTKGVSSVVSLKIYLIINFSLSRGCYVSHARYAFLGLLSYPLAYNKCEMNGRIYVNKWWKLVLITRLYI